MRQAHLEEICAARRALIAALIAGGCLVEQVPDATRRKARSDLFTFFNRNLAQFSANYRDLARGAGLNR
jgi:hypothetical protein